MEDQVLGAGVAGERLEARRWGRSVLAAFALAVVLPLVVGLGAAAVLGWRFQVIETASMAPAFAAGSLAVVQPVEPAELGPGRVVVFEDPLVPGRLIAHRIVKPLPSASPMWMTKGDANRESDPAPVSSASIRGQVRWAIPSVGPVVSALHGPFGGSLLVGTPLAILLLTEIAARRRRRLAA